MYKFYKFSSEKHFYSLDYEDDFLSSGGKNITPQQQFFSERKANRTIQNLAINFQEKLTDGLIRHLSHRR